MEKISIDLETYSSVDLKKCGVYKYAESPDFEILLFGYSVDDGPVQVVDLAQGEKIPFDIISALWNENVQKWAFNAQFERVCLQNWLKSSVLFRDKVLEPKGWYCSKIWSATLGLPLTLEGVGSILKLEQQKMKEGKDLIRFFCVPCKPTKKNNGRTRNLPKHDSQKWEIFKAYNKRDVETEMNIQKKLSRFPVPEQIWQEYWQDQEINDRGIRIDQSLVKAAIHIDEKIKIDLIQELQDKTALDNPNSVIQLKTWLEDNDNPMESLGKKEVAAAISEVPAAIAEVLCLRQQLTKSSVKKYTAMDNSVCKDGRAHGMFQFYGANRTGRFAGRIVQLQNLPQNHMSDLVQARSLVRSNNMEGLKVLYDDIPDTLSQLIRTAFIPAVDRKFIVADFSAIEARVIAWLAGEEWRMEVFKEGKDIYCASASAMFKVPVEKHGVNRQLRQKGKVAELALGYGGSVGALKAMGALNQGLEESELKPLVEAWRQSNPKITELWWAVDRCVKETVKTKKPTKTHGLGFSYESGFLFITLPSGRRLAYVKPRIGENRFGGESVTYEGVGSTKKWERIESYGPKFVENIVQGIARDILCFAMQDFRYCDIVAHVHDEIIMEADLRMSVEAVCRQMARTPDWAPGLLLRADGYECSFYKKD